MGLLLWRERSDIVLYSALAACNYGEKIHLFFQGTDGSIRETKSDDGDTFSFSGVLPTPTPPMALTPLAATCYDYGTQVRVYYLDESFTLQEMCWTEGEGWYAGGLNDAQIKMATYSALSVIWWSYRFRVYGQRESDHKIIEVARDGTNPWVISRELKVAVAATSITAIRTGDGTLRVYYQAPDLTIRQLTNRDAWSDDTEVTAARAAHLTALSAVSINSTTTDIRLYFQRPNDNNFAEIAHHAGTSGWWGPLPLGNAMMRARMTAVSWGNTSSIRVYTQNSGLDIVERKWVDGAGWGPGSVIPTA